MNVPTPRRQAFTLVELLIVITIIGILVVALTPRLLGSQASARDASRFAAIQQIATALEFVADANNGAYIPAAGGECVASLPVLPQFLTVVPADPLEGNAFQGAGPDCSADGGYLYFSMNNDLSYVLIAQLENSRKTGAGIYDASMLDFTGTDASDVLSDSVLCSDANADCEANGAVYLVGR